jgi:DnaJ-class molecular chaperone
MADHRDEPLIDWYAQLEVAPDATPAEIDAAYRRLARALHPDSARPESVDVERLQRVLEAHAVLSNPARRGDYDKFLRPPPTQSANAPRCCPVCRGTRKIMTPCAACRASGYQQSARPWLSTPRPCAVCDGTGRRPVGCGACAGTGNTNARRRPERAEE